MPKHREILRRQPSHAGGGGLGLRVVTGEQRALSASPISDRKRTMPAACATSEKRQQATLASRFIGMGSGSQVDCGERLFVWFCPFAWIEHIDRLARVVVLQKGRPWVIWKDANLAYEGIAGIF